MKVFDFTDYRTYIRARVAELPRGGRGEYRRIADKLGIQSSVLSQIMGESRGLSAEMASSLCEYYGFGELETDYFLVLVQLDGAGNRALRAVLTRQLADLRARGQQIVHRIQRKTVLKEPEQAIFCSQWYYSAVRLLTSIPGRHTPDAIAEQLGLPRVTVTRAVEFLLAHGLCVQDKGKLRIGPQILHLPADSALVSRLHANWRLKAMEHFDRLGPDELAYTTSVVISEKDAPVIRQMLLQLIDRFGAAVDRSGCEKLYCFNLDWVNIA